MNDAPLARSEDRLASVLTVRATGLCPFDILAAAPVYAMPRARLASAINGRDLGSGSRWRGRASDGGHPGGDGPRSVLRLVQADAPGGLPLLAAAVAR